MIQSDYGTAVQKKTSEITWIVREAQSVYDTFSEEERKEFDVIVAAMEHSSFDDLINEQAQVALRILNTLDLVWRISHRETDL